MDGSKSRILCGHGVLTGGVASAAPEVPILPPPELHLTTTVCAPHIILGVSCHRFDTYSVLDDGRNRCPETMLGAGHELGHNESLLGCP